MSFNSLHEYFTKIFIKIEKIFVKVKDTSVYHKALESYNFFLNIKTKIIKNDFFVILFNYKNGMFLKDVEKTKLFLNECVLDKISTVYKRSLFLINLLYIKYLENFFLIIKNKIKNLMEKYHFLEKKFNLYVENKEVSNKNNYILKQNKFISYHSIVSLLGSRQRNNIYAANSSLWPVFLSIFVGIFVLLFVCVLHNQNFLSFLNKQLLVAIFGGAISISFWITTFYKEKQLGFHTYEVRRNIRLGFYIFIFTEAICFLSLFWTFLHALLAASLNIGLHNPGEGIVHFWMTEARLFHPYWERFYYLENQKALLINLTDQSVYRNKKVFDKNLVIKVHINLHDKGQLINPYKYPLMNTFILLASACSLNASHTQIKMGKYLTALLLLLFTITLGLAFVFIQYKEIRNCSIQFTDGIYGSCFYSLTGLHGTHVILGIFGLFICFLNFLKHNYSQKRHDTYWFAILYWHFVDIIWILVYLIIYIWPSFYFHRSGVRWAQLDYNSYCFNFSQEAFENTLYYKLYNDRTKLNHSLINYAVLKLDNDNLFKNNQNIVFNYEKQNEANYKEINNLNTKFINLFIENKNKFKLKRTLKEVFSDIFKNQKYDLKQDIYLDYLKNEKNFIKTKKINSLRKLFNLNDNNFFYNDVSTRKPTSNFTNKHLILSESVYVDYLKNEKNFIKTEKINSLRKLFNLNDNNFFYNDVSTRKPTSNFTNKHLILSESVYVDYLLKEKENKKKTNKKLILSESVYVDYLLKQEENKKKTKKLSRFIEKFLTKKNICINYFAHENSDNKEVKKINNITKKFNKILKHNNFSILDNLENKSKILDSSNLLYDLINYFNYNGIKKRTAEHAIVLNIAHYAIFHEIQTQEVYDVLNKKYKIFFFFLLNIIDKKLCFLWCKYLTPYFFLNLNTILLETTEAQRTESLFWMHVKL